MTRKVLVDADDLEETLEDIEGAYMRDVWAGERHQRLRKALAVDQVERITQTMLDADYVGLGPEDYAAIARIVLGVTE